MNIFEKFFNKLYNKLFKKIDLIYKILTPFYRKKAFLFGSPIHANMGDQAQTFCIKQWIEIYYPGYKIVLIPHINTKFYIYAQKLIKKHIRERDKIFGHSGYFMIDHHWGYRDFCKIIKLFSKHKIVIFPQTINFHKRSIEQNTAEIFNAHSNVTLMCRDEVSYKRAKQVFDKCNLLLFPDIVTTLIGKKQYNNKNRNGVLFVKRSDMESYFSTDDIIP